MGLAPTIEGMHKGAVIRSLVGILKYTHDDLQVPSTESNYPHGVKSTLEDTSIRYPIWYGSSSNKAGMHNGAGLRSLVGTLRYPHDDLQVPST